MSRCFPFPPPGYEKKPRPQDANILKEEKHKEKKPKKEKREKEKREGKEKRDKEKSDEKHKEKRDRKEKHKDNKEKHREKKDKGKDKSKEKEKSSISDFSKVTGILDARSGEKINPKGNIYCLGEKNHVAKFNDQNREKYVQSNIIPQENDESKFVEELGRRITNENAAINQSVDRFSTAEKKRNEETQRSAVRNAGDLAEDVGKRRDKRFENKTMDVQGISEEARFSGNSMVQGLMGKGKAQVDLVPGFEEKIDERKLDRRDKSKERAAKRGEKHKNEERDKNGHRKVKDREKERKKEAKTKEKSDGLEVNKSVLVGCTDGNSSFLSYENSDANIEVNLKKRKETHNGLLHDDDTRSNKLPRPISHPVTQNGRKLEASQIPSLSNSEKPGIVNPKVDKMDRRKNGIIELQPLPTSKLKPMPKWPPVTSNLDVVEESKKPPHPDLKYLSQILLVPKMDEWSEFDDQEWLFGSRDPPSRKPEICSPCSGEGQQVWCDTLHIESADVVALPYVLPY